MPRLDERALTLTPVLDIASTPMDPALRNELITLAYQDLAEELSRELGSDFPNWCTFAQWSSNVLEAVLKDRDPLGFRSTKRALHWGNRNIYAEVGWFLTVIMDMPANADALLAPLRTGLLAGIGSPGFMTSWPDTLSEYEKLMKQWRPGDPDPGAGSPLAKKRNAVVEKLTALELEDRGRRLQRVTGGRDRPQKGRVDPSRQHHDGEPRAATRPDRPGSGVQAPGAPLRLVRSPPRPSRPAS